MTSNAELTVLLNQIDALKIENASLEAEITGASGSVVMYDLACADETVRFSPYCWRIKYALAHKGIKCDYKAWHFAQKDMLKPSGQVTLCSSPFVCGFVCCIALCLLLVGFFIVVLV